MTLNFTDTSVNGQSAFTVQGNTGDLLRLLARNGYNAAMWLIIMKMTMSVTPVSAGEVGIAAGMANPPLTFPETSRSFVQGLAQSLSNPNSCQLQ